MLIKSVASIIWQVIIKLIFCRLTLTLNDTSLKRIHSIISLFYASLIPSHLLASLKLIYIVELSMQGD